MICLYVLYYPRLNIFLNEFIIISRSIPILSYIIIAPIDKNGILNKLYNDLIGKELTKQKMEKIAEAAEEEKRVSYL